MNEILSAPQYYLARLFFDRGLALLYFVAFLSAFNQFPALLGEKGLLPAPDYIKRVTFHYSPGLFHWKYSDSFLRGICLLGILLSLILFFGLLDTTPILIHMFTWLTLYFLYLSIVNVGQEFYGFGWETMLLEAGFFAAFMGPSWVSPSWIPILILRWMLFRTELGAGLIKLRGDSCWKDFTCLYYHFETQPLPNPLSRLFHFQPKWFHRMGVGLSHFCQLVAPFGLFLPWPVASISGLFLIIHQLILVVSGNYSWLNWLTICLSFLAISHSHSPSINLAPIPWWFLGVQCGIFILALILSYRPLLNLFSSRQFMNYCWNRWHLVGAYGAFGSVTKERYEVVIEGSSTGFPEDESSWLEYEFKGKPGALDRIPPIVAPYHLRLDWMIWFLPFSVMVRNKNIYIRGHSLYFIRLMKKLLQHDQQILKLFRSVPFRDVPPRWVRARFYEYHFTDREDYRRSGLIWKRELLGEYFPAVSQEDFVND